MTKILNFAVIAAYAVMLLTSQTWEIVQYAEVLKMGSVVQLFDAEKDFKWSNYFKDCHGAIGVCSNDKSIAIRPLNSSTVEINLGSETKVFDRRELAEFLKISAILLDSEDRYLPPYDLVGMNYDT